MRVTKEKWSEAHANLQARRERGTVGSDVNAERIRDYAAHLSKITVGNTLLDIGCGDMGLERWVPHDTQYAGLDPFPVNDKVAFPHSIEDSPLPDNSYETITAFAVMDNLLDFDKAVTNIKRIASRNVLFLTGVNIPVDDKHTFQLSLEDYDRRFADWKQGYRERLAYYGDGIGVWLLEYIKPKL